MFSKNLEESRTEGEGPGSVKRREGSECAPAVGNLRKLKPETLRVGKRSHLVLMTEAGVGTEYLPGNFQGSYCYYIKYKCP